MKKLLILAAGCALLGSVAWAADAAPTAATAPADYYVAQLHLTVGADMTPEQQTLMLGHVGHLVELYDQGVLFMAGPFESGTEGIEILQAHSMEEARGYVESDPSVKAGLMEVKSVDMWWAAESRPDNRRFTVEDFMQMMPPQAARSGQVPGETTRPDGGLLTMADLPEAVMPPEPVEPPATPDGALVHFELPSTDFKQTQEFYGKLFGWKFQAMGEMYLLFSTPGGEGGGFTADYKPGEGGGVFYIYAADVAAKAAEVKAAGGTIVLDTFAVPGYGWIAQFKDPQGNRIGLFSGNNPPPGESPVPPMPTS